MTLRWAYSRNEAVAAHGSKANSSLPGVMLGVGGFSLESDLTLELLEVERCLLSPVDMSRRSMKRSGVSRGRVHKNPQGA